jgi:DNA-binding SARP family transcriptional activator
MVTIGTKSLDLGSGRQRVILAMLLLHAGRTVPLTRLVDALWDDNPPVTAKGQVQTCVSALRKQFKDLGADGLVSTSPAGYGIDIPEGSLDITTFEYLAERGRTAAAEHRAPDAVRDIRAALALWRGPAAADVPSALVQIAATRLNENRLSLVEECISLELAIGRHQVLLGELSELVREYPLRETFRAQHMLALYRSGRQAEALESFQEARQTLIAELGVEPGERLGSLQQAILSRDTGLDPHGESEPRMNQARLSGQAVPHQLPAAIPDFTGREDLLSQLTDLLSAPEPPGGRRYLPIVSLNGKGGVGKTTLALHVAHAVSHRYPDGQLFLQLHGADGQPENAMDLMASALRSLGHPPVALPPNLAERTAIYRSWLAERKVLIVLDDAYSVSEILPLIPGSPSCGVIVTSRNPLSSLAGARHYEVEDLDEATSVELLARVVGAERMRGEPAAARELVRLCGYLPLALRIVAAKLATRRHWTITKMISRMTDEARRLDELALSGTGIRATLATSCHGLSTAARRLFVRLSLLGPVEFASWVSAPLLDLDLDDANELLEELVEARLVEVRVSENEMTRLQLHDLVRIYAMELIVVEQRPEDRAAALERLLSCWLSLASEAHHRAYGGDHAVLHGSAPRWTLPDDVHAQLLSSPMEWFRAERAGLVYAVTQAARVGLDELCWDLAVTSVTLFESEFRVEDWQKTHELALEAVRRAGNVRGEAAVRYSLGNLALNGKLGEASDHLLSAFHIFDQIGDGHGRLLALAGLAFADRLSGRNDRAMARYHEVLAGCREVGDLVTEIDALSNIAQIELEREQLQEAWGHLEEAANRCRLVKAPRIIAQTEHRRGQFYLRTGDLWRAEQSFRAVLKVARDTGDMVGETYALADLATVCTRLGQYEQALADLSAAVTMSRHMTSNLVHGRVLHALAELHFAMAESPEAALLISEALVVFSESGPAPVWRGRFLELKARIDDQAGNPTAALAARREALELIGDADPVLVRSLIAALSEASAKALAHPAFGPLSHPEIG